MDKISEGHLKMVFLSSVCTTKKHSSAKTEGGEGADKSTLGVRESHIQIPALPFAAHKSPSALCQFLRAHLQRLRVKG